MELRSENGKQLNIYDPKSSDLFMSRLRIFCQRTIQRPYSYLLQKIEKNYE